MKQFDISDGVYLFSWFNFVLCTDTLIIGINKPSKVSNSTKVQKFINSVVKFLEKETMSGICTSLHFTKQILFQNYEERNQ